MGSLPKRMPGPNGIKYVPWMAIFEADLKLDWSEKNPGDNPLIQKAFKLCGYSTLPDETPWCGVYVGSTLLKAGYEIPKSCARARSYSSQDYGIPLGDPEYGCIVNVESGSAGGSSHVGFLLAWNANWVRIGGGNQSDKVTDTYLARRSRVLSYKLPTLPE